MFEVPALRSIFTDKTVVQIYTFLLFPLKPPVEAGDDSLDEVEAAIEIPLQAGDAAFFVDCMAHGSARRTNPSERRVLIIRYGPHWGNDRYGFQPSPNLIAKLTAERRRIVQPLPPKIPPDA